MKRVPAAGLAIATMVALADPSAVSAQSPTADARRASQVAVPPSTMAPSVGLPPGVVPPPVPGPVPARSMSDPLPGSRAARLPPVFGPPATLTDDRGAAADGSAIGDDRPVPASVSVDPGAYAAAMPRAAHGRLAQVDWPRAPALVPHALEDAINIVTRAYPTAGAARAALRAAASDLRASRYQWLPSISASATRYNSGRGYPDGRGLVPQLQVDQPIWTGDRIGSSIRRAHASEDASSAQYVDTVHTLALTTAQTYFDIVRLTQREQLLIASLREHQRLVDTIDRRTRQEVSPLADLELARSRTAQVEQDLNATHAQRLTSLRIMAQLVADVNFDIGPVPYYDPAIDLAAQDVLEEQAAVYSPQLRQLAAQVDVARADLDGRKAALLPQIGAQYTYDVFLGHRIGAVVRAQNDATQLPQVNAARTRITQAQDNRLSSEVELRREVASDLILYRSSRVQVRVGHEAAVTAVAVSESFMRQYIAGRRSWLDVMNQLREAVNAQIQESDSQVAVMATAVRLTIESGRWRPTFDVTAP